MADYPELIHLDEATKTAFAGWMDNELTQHYMERSQNLQDLEDMQHSYWAQPPREEVTFPFQGAASLVIPLNAIAVEAIHARTMTTIFQLDQLVSVKGVSPEWEDVEQPLEKFLDQELRDNIKVYKPINDAILELEKYGTGVLKSGYCREVKTAVRSIDGSSKEIEVVVKDGATLDAVPISRFLMPYASLDAQTSLWCGEEHSMTPHEIFIKEQSGFFYPGTYDKVQQSVSQTEGFGERDFERSQEELENREIIIPSRINFHEIWCAWNTDMNGEGKRREIVVHYHRTTRTFMAVRYNWYDDLRRPYRHGVYFPIEHRWYGIGVIKQNDQFQEEITTKHRQMLDNATLANMRMIKINKQSGYGPSEPLFAGKMWFLDDMTHIDSFQLAEIYPSGYMSESSTMQLSQQRTGVNELTLGQPGAGTPGTAADVLSRIQEGNKKFGYTFFNIKQLINQAFLDTVCCIHQFGPRNVTYFDFAENGKRVQEFLRMPESYIRDGILVTIHAAGQLENRMLDRQNLMQMAQVYQQYATGQIELAQLLAQADPNMLPLIVSQLQKGSTELMSRFFQTFEFQNINRLLVKLPETMHANQAGAAGVGGNTQASPATGLVSPPQTSQALPGISA